MLNNKKIGLDFRPYYEGRTHTAVGMSQCDGKVSLVGFARNQDGVSDTWHKTIFMDGKFAKDGTCENVMNRGNTIWTNNFYSRQFYGFRLKYCSIEF